MLEASKGRTGLRQGSLTWGCSCCASRIGWMDGEAGVGFVFASTSQGTNRAGSTDDVNPLLPLLFHYIAIFVAFFINIFNVSCCS
jgi:hypothetical protein